MLTLYLGVDLRFAIGASLVSVITTSCGSAAAYFRNRLCIICIEMFLEIATTIIATQEFGCGFWTAGSLASRVTP